MNSGTKADLSRQFVRGVVVLGGVFSVVFAGEAAFEYFRLGRPSLADLSWVGVNNAKLVDALSPMARAYNNVLAMLLATVGLAIPLTANMHTPKLIDLFVKDRVNRIVLPLMALGAANSLFVIYLIGPNFAPMWAFRLAIYGALFGWAVLIPYYVYVIRFLDPSTILWRLKGDVIDFVTQARHGKIDFELAQSEIQERLYQIGTIVIKSIDRADRSVAREGIWELKRVIDGYYDHKEHMAPAWFVVDKGDFPGMSHHAIAGIATKKKWLEMHVVYQLYLCYQHALAKAPDAVSAITNVSRIVALKAAQHDDTSVISMCIRFFNTFLREAINRRDARAAFDIFYQYRQLAGELGRHPKFIGRIAGFMSTYAKIAFEHQLVFVSDLAGYDLCHVMEEAYRAELPVADDVLTELLALPNERGGVDRPSRVRVKLIAAGYFAEHGMTEQLSRVTVALRELPLAVVEDAFTHLTTVAKQHFWEITDRAVNIEWTEPERREHMRHVMASLAEAAKA